MPTKLLDFSKLYRLPFSKNDNFNGWIEITTRCNIACPGCYRGCDQKNHKGKDKSLAEIKTEIDMLDQIRNPSMISISGGEPTLHPELPEIITYVRSKGINPILFTNGQKLSPHYLKNLRKAGLIGAVVRLDSLQNEYSHLKESQLNEHRAKYSEMFHQAGLFLTLTTCIDWNNLDQISQVLDWGIANSPKIGQFLLILKRQLVLKEEDILPDSAFVFPDDLIGQLKKDLPQLSFAAYLGSQRETLSVKWLQAFRFIQRKKLFGYGDKKFVELLQIFHHYTRGRYLGIVEKKYNFINILSLIGLACLNKSLRKVLGRFLIACLKNPLRLFLRIAVQPITVVIPPHFINGKRDLCDACPDAILYNNQLVPSCSLEEIKALGQTYVKAK